MTIQNQMAVWRHHYEEIHESMIKSRGQFLAWSQEVAMFVERTKP